MQHAGWPCGIILNLVLGSREELASIIKAWAETKNIEEFFADAEWRAADLSDDEKYSPGTSEACP